MKLMQVPQKAYSRARPIRVAFLVNDHEHSSAMLDAIFQDCMGRWGGRFSLIIPTTEAGPKESYLDWLQTFDPDIIYSYVDMDNAIVESLHERFYPSFLVYHKFNNRTERDAYAFRPNLNINSLKVTSLIPLATLPTIFNGSRNGYFLEAKGELHKTPFINDSFGFFEKCVGRGYTAPLNEFGKTITLVADADCQPRERYISQGTETVPDIISLLDFASTKNLITMSQLSAMATPRLEISSQKWGNTFNIIVGDTFTDRIIYWNARSLYGKWRDRDCVDIRIPSSYLNDTDMLNAIGKFITKRNNVSRQGGSSTPSATVRSSSVSQDNLNIIITSLKGSANWVQYTPEVLSTDDDCLPTAAELKSARFSVSENFMAVTASLWNETYVGDKQVDIIPPAPEPLKYNPAHLQPHDECWAIDIDIERRVNHSLLSNVVHRWKLPRRLRITRAFLSGYQVAGQHSAVVVPRVTNHGLLALYANVTSKTMPISLPDDEDAIIGAFTSGRDWEPLERKSEPQMPQQLLKDIHRSSSGRYFAGALGIFRTLNEANNILLHLFWKEQFEKLGASNSKTEKTRDKIETILVKRFGTSGAELPRDKTKLADIILDEAENHRTSIPCRSWNHLEEDFSFLQKRYWDKNPLLNGTPAEQEEYKKNEVLLFKEYVQELCEKGILYQGYEQKCSKCLHKSWFAIGNLSPKIKCEVCRNEEPAPVDKPWQFRLNEFVRESLRKHGVWPLFWTLSKVRNHQESSFYFAGPLDVYTNNTRWDGTKDTDIDLTIISDGVVRMCEVKQSIRQLTPDIAKEYANLMLKLRPDIATLAVMEAKTSGLKTIFDEFSKQLAGSDIKPELLTLEEGDFDDTP